MKVKLSKLIFFIFLLLSLILASCGAFVPEPTLTATATNTLTPTFTPTITLTPTKTPTPTITPNLVATQQYETFIEQVKQFYEQGYIPSTKGTYQHLEDYSDSFAQAEYYQWNQIVPNAKSFIVRSDLTMETVNQTFARGGCGFVIHGYDMLMLSQKGNVYRFDPIFGIGPTNYLGESFNPWSLEIVLIYSGNNAWLFVDGKETLKANLNGLYQDNNELAFAVISGSNDDFGTRCDFKNNDFWLIEE